ncbi:MAG: hypothetical protein RSF75_07040, partial [Acidaminococcaceae bacterium]
PRTQTILAVSLAIGIGFNSVAGALDMFPFWVSTMLCGVPGTAFTAVILNILLPGRNLKKQSIADDSTDCKPDEKPDLDDLVNQNS